MPLVYLNLGLEASRDDFGAISDPSGMPWKPKNTVKYKVFAVFHVAPQTSSRSSKSAPWKAQKDPQEAPRSGPGRPRSRPGGSKSAKKRPKSALRAAQTRLPSGLGGQVETSELRSPFWTRRAGFASSGGRFSYSFLFSESIAKIVLWAKLAQTYAQHRFTSLCNFYKWISTATDSRSRSTNPCMNS